MIKYILVVISIVVLVLIGYMQIKKERNIEKYFNKTNAVNKVSINDSSESKVKVNETKEKKTNEITLNFITAQDTTDNISDFNKEMEENEKDIIIRSLEENENLTQTYNSEEEEDIPVSEPYDMSIAEEVPVTPLELDNIEIVNGLQPKVEYNDSLILEDTPMTESTLEEIEVSSGLQNTEESKSKPLETEGFEPI